MGGRGPSGWLRVFFSETLRDLEGFGKPLECLEQGDDKLCFHLTVVWRLGRGCGGSPFEHMRKALAQTGQGLL